MGDELAAGYKTEQWAGGQPWARWYDKYGRSRVLPADPYSLEHYRAQGLRLYPPETPEPLVEKGEFLAASRGEAPIPTSADAPSAATDSEMFGGLPFVEPKRKGRGPDKKPRKKRKKRRNRA